MKPVYYVVPAIIFSFFWGFYPFAYSIYISFFNYNLQTPKKFTFAGLNNYVKLLTSVDFWGAIGNSVFFLIVCLAIELVVGLGVAMLLAREFRGVGIVRTIVTLPVLLIPMGVTVMWKLMVMPGMGILNEATEFLGWGTIPWLGHPIYSKIIIIFVEVWQWMPFVTLILLAAILSLPKEPYEAAKVDGIPTTMVFTKITLPLLRPVLAIVVILRALDLFKLAEPVYGLSRGGAGTETISFFIYRIAFRVLNIGLGGAVSLLFWVLAWILATVMVRRLVRLS
jgi:multiple sugar transport system permease protein